LNDGTLLYLATDTDRSGPWIYALDLERRTSRRISTGLEQYTSLSASADGRRLVATISRSMEQLWRVPIADHLVDESSATPLSLPTGGGLSPRLGLGYIIYRSPKAGSDALWKLTGSAAAAQLWSITNGRTLTERVRSGWQKSSTCGEPLHGHRMVDLWPSRPIGMVSRTCSGSPSVADRRCRS
jgi:Tol biopolymer transport system component